MSSKQILVIAPHADDEVFGVGGYVHKAVNNGAKADLVIAATGGIQHLHLNEKVSTSVKIDELNQAAKVIGFSQTCVLYPDKDMMLDTIPMTEMVSKLDKLLDEYEYDEVLIPYPSHNRDHQIIFKAAWASLRIKPGKIPVPLVALYEYPFVSWTYESIKGGKLYVDISEEIENKIRALQCYKTQLREPPSPCSVDSMIRLADARGLECGCKFAELIYVQRHIIR